MVATFSVCKSRSVRSRTSSRDGRFWVWSAWWRSGSPGDSNAQEDFCPVQGLREEIPGAGGEARRLVSGVTSAVRTRMGSTGPWRRAVGAAAMTVKP